MKLYFGQNFIINASESQLGISGSGPSTPKGSALELLDKIFTAIFAFDLAVNIFAHWYHCFQILHF